MESVLEVKLGNTVRQTFSSGSEEKSMSGEDLNRGKNFVRTLSVIKLSLAVSISASKYYALICVVKDLSVQVTIYFLRIKRMFDLS